MQSLEQSFSIIKLTPLTTVYKHAKHPTMCHSAWWQCCNWDACVHILLCIATQSTGNQSIRLISECPKHWLIHFLLFIFKNLRLFFHILCLKPMLDVLLLLSYLSYSIKAEVPVDSYSYLGLLLWSPLVLRKYILMQWVVLLCSGTWKWQ